MGSKYDLNNLQGVFHHLGIPLGGLATGMLVGFVRTRKIITYKQLKKCSVEYRWKTMQLSILKRCTILKNVKRKRNNTHSKIWRWRLKII
jgi:hypothetical protein